MRVAILQPSYLPWLGYFDQIHRADVFVFYDDVQYDKHGWRNRNRIKTPQGPHWLTVPVLLTGHFGQKIREVRIDPTQPWKKKHRRSLHQAYESAPYYPDLSAFLDEMYEREWDRLTDLVVWGIRGLCDRLGIDTQLAFSSDLGLKGERTERLVNICRHFAADEYLTGDAAEDYLEEERFREAGIRITYQRYAHPTYPQGHGEFLSHLSIVDLFVYAGPRSLSILSGGVPHEA